MKNNEINEVRDFLSQIIQQNLTAMSYHREDDPSAVVDIELPAQAGEVAYFIQFADDNWNVVSSIYIDTYDNQRIVENVDCGIDDFVRKDIVFKDGGCLTYKTSLLKQLIEGDMNSDLQPQDAFSIGFMEIHPESKLEAMFGFVRMMTVLK